MGIAAWVLIGLAFVVTIILMPQTANSRRLMGQSRNEDRFSEGLRVLDLHETPKEAHSVEVVIHKKPGEKNLRKTATRPIRMAQDLRAYSEAKALRAAETAKRASSARRRAGFLVALLIITVFLAVGAAMSALPWWALSLPGVGVFGTLIGGSLAAGRGRRRDVAQLQQIREMEKRLEQTPAGRAALHAGKGRSRSHWARVARESLGDIPKTRTLNEAVQQHTPKVEQSVQSVVEEPPAEPAATPKPTSEATNKPRQDDIAKQETSAEKHAVVSIPAPTYTLKAAAARRDVDAIDFSSDWEEDPVPMRPHTARVLPAGESLTSSEVNSEAISVDLESILERRRISGD